MKSRPRLDAERPFSVHSSTRPDGRERRPLASYRIGIKGASRITAQWGEKSARPAPRRRMLNKFINLFLDYGSARLKAAARRPSIILIKTSLNCFCEPLFVRPQLSPPAYG